MGVNGKLNQPVLVLNNSYEPIQVSTVKRAITLTLLHKAEMIEATGEKLHSISQEYDVPSVIRILKYVRLPFALNEVSRKNILIRDNYQCQYCGARGVPLTIDHIIPKDRGGRDTWENLITACLRCNNKKGNRTPQEASMKLLSKPTRPNRIHQIRFKVSRVFDSWKPYLFMD